MIFNSTEDTYKYIKKLLEQDIKINERSLKKICSLNNVIIEKVMYVEGDNNKAILNDIELLENNSVKIVFSKSSWVNELPSLYHENEFLKRFMFGFQKSHQEVENKIDNVSSQFIPTKTEFVEWLSSWVGVSFSKDINEDSKRKVMSDIIRLYSIRGTKQYFIDLIKHLTQVDVRIDDSKKYRTLHHNLVTKSSNKYLMQIHIDKKISEDKEEEEKKLSIINSIILNEKPINVEFELVYKYMKSKKVEQELDKKVFKINAQTDDYYNYDELE